MPQHTARDRRPQEPRIDRSLTLHLRGDWGSANLHRVCGWISQELTDRCGPHTRIANWNSRGFSASSGDTSRRPPDQPVPSRPVEPPA